jgi:hypothetical protein
MIMLVDTRSPKRNGRPPSTFWFLVITLGPWVLLLWLLSPSR